MLDFLAQRYGGRPSDWAEYRLDGVWRDVEAAHAAIKHESRHRELSESRARSRGKRR